LEATYKSALEHDRWTGTYAAKNRGEYWAEAVQSYFDTNRENDEVHNHVNSRAELKEYDRRLFDLVDRVFVGNQFRYSRPQSRMDSPHLRGLDRETLPKFKWRE
jgi:hypothetical protein